MTNVSRSEFARIRRLAAERKAKREEKRATLPWGQKQQEKAKTDLLFFARRVFKKPRAKSPRELLRAKLDSLWAFLVKLRDRLAFGGLCRICGRRPIEVAYHIVPRGDDATRWDPENGVGACAACNRGEQMNRHRYRAKHIQLFGREKIEALEAKARTKAMFSMEQLEEIAAELKRQIENLTRGGRALGT